VLSVNYDKVDLLERMITYSAGFDDEVYKSSVEALEQLWAELQTMNPDSALVKVQVARAATLRRAGKISRASEPNRTRSFHPTSAAAKGNPIHEGASTFAYSLRDGERYVPSRSRARLE